LLRFGRESGAVWGKDENFQNKNPIKIKTKNRKGVKKCLEF